MDDFDRPVALAGETVTFTVEAGPGKLSTPAAKSDASGTVQVKVTSTAGSSQYYNSSAGYWTYFSQVKFDAASTVTNYDTNGWGYFSRGRLVDLTADKSQVRADGVDKAILSATVLDQAFGMPVSGWPITSRRASARFQRRPPLPTPQASRTWTSPPPWPASPR